MSTNWKPYDSYVDPKSDDDYFLLRPCGMLQSGNKFIPTVVRRSKGGTLFDPGGNQVRFKRHNTFEWTEIPD